MNKPIVIIISGIAAIGIGILIYKSVTSGTKVDDGGATSDGGTTNKPTTTDGPTSARPTPIVPKSGTFPLTKGMSGNEDVKKMQKALMSKFSIIIQAGATGNFGEQTSKALVSIGYLGDSVTKAEYENILSGLKRGQSTTDLTKLKKDDKIVFLEDAPIYSSLGYGDIGKAKKASVARYDSEAGGGWSKITVMEYYVKGPIDPETGKETWVYKFSQKPAYARTYTFKKK